MTAAHLAKVRELPCCVCGAIGVHAHHARGGSMAENGFHQAKGKKVSDYLAIPLCHDHHTGANGIHSLGVATWERLHGAQLTNLLSQSFKMQMTLLSLAKQPVERKPRKPSSKVVKRPEGQIV